MIALLLLAQVATPVPESDIVVLGRRLETASVTVGKDARGRFTCAADQSTGNLDLDARLCRTAAKCVAKGAATPEAVSSCIDKRKPALLNEARRALRGAA